MPGAKARLRLDGADPINRGLVGFWPLTDGAGGRAVDLSPYGKHGAMENSPGRYVGLPGRTMNFTGGAAGATNVNLGNPSQFNALQVPLTITGWAYPTASPLNAQTMLAQYGVFTAGGLVKHVSIDGGVLRYISSNASGVVQVFTAGAMTAGKWQFWAVTMVGTLAAPSLAMYVNLGVTTHTPGALFGSPNTAIVTRIGTSTTALNAPSNEGYQGQLQNIRMWNRALLPREIRRLYSDPWAGTARTRQPALYNSYPPLSATIAGTIPITAEITAALQPFDVGGDTHDGLRQSRRLRRIEALRRRADDERLADAQALRLALEAALGVAAELPPEEAPRVAEAVQRAPKPADVDWRRVAEDAEQYARLSRAVSRLSALVQAEARRRADDDDDDAAFLLGIA